MIGHYLLTLTPAQEERVLTTPFGPVSSLRAMRELGCDRCLVMAAEDKQNWQETSQSRRWVDAFWRLNAEHREVQRELIPGMRYERLCTRFGAERVNRAIRNRILANIARRTLRAPVTPLVLSRPLEEYHVGQ